MESEEYDAAQLGEHAMGLRVAVEYGDLKMAGTLVEIKHEYAYEIWNDEHSAIVGVSTLKFRGLSGEVCIPVDSKVQVFR